MTFAVGLVAALVIGAVVGAWIAARHARRVDEERASALRTDVARRRATWLHDDVLPEINLLRLMIARGELGSGEVRRELDGIEHRLRILQLDADLAAGGVPMSSAIQPFIRMAQQAEVSVVAVPLHDVASRELTPDEGYELRRFLSVAVPNAILAGARSIGFYAEQDGARSFRVTVVDDAGGFDVTDPTHAGRGRDRLRCELGDDRLTTTTDGDRTRFTLAF